MTYNRLLRFAAPLALALAAAAPAAGQKLVILHTNDTHSNIDPDGGVGGILQRKAIIDSVRAAERDVVLIDAGDIVQGSLYFKFFRGKVEYPLLNMMGYDIRVLGNHEFDNGLADMARWYRQAKGSRLSANYDFKGTEAEGIFDPYVIKRIGGKRIGFIGLNVDPRSLIAKAHTEGMRFLPIIETANRTARMLREQKKCDLIVAVTHIGYDNKADAWRETDVKLAAESKDIDIIIGGHSHTLVDPTDPKSPPSVMLNAEGRPVLIAQTGKYGRNIGKIEVDLSKVPLRPGADGAAVSYSLIPVTDRFAPEKLDSRMMQFLKPYKKAVDSINAHTVAYVESTLPNGRATGALPNFTGDFGLTYSRHKADSLTRAGTPMRVDAALMNTGGIRQSFPEGALSEGRVLSAYPFSNRVVILEISGADFIEAMRAAARRGGEAVSGNLLVLTDGNRGVVDVLIDGQPMNPEATYYIATIDYLAEGNDSMESLARGKRVWTDDVELTAPMLRHISEFGERGITIAPDPTPRFRKVAPIPATK